MTVTCCVKVFGALGLLAALAACSSSPEDRLNGSWDCSIDGQYVMTQTYNLKNHTISLSSDDRTKDGELEILQADQEMLTVSMGEPDAKDTAIITFTGTNTFQLALEDGSLLMECVRK